MLVKIFLYVGIFSYSPELISVLCQLAALDRMQSSLKLLGFSLEGLLFLRVTVTSNIRSEQSKNFSFVLPTSLLRTSDCSLEEHCKNYKIRTQNSRDMVIHTTFGLLLYTVI